MVLERFLWLQHWRGCKTVVQQQERSYGMEIIIPPCSLGIVDQTYAIHAIDSSGAEPAL